MQGSGGEDLIEWAQAGACLLCTLALEPVVLGAGNNVFNNCGTLLLPGSSGGPLCYAPFILLSCLFLMS